MIDFFVIAVQKLNATYLAYWCFHLVGEHWKFLTVYPLIFSPFSRTGAPNSRWHFFSQLAYKVVPLRLLSLLVLMLCCCCCWSCCLFVCPLFVCVAMTANLFVVGRAAIHTHTHTQQYPTHQHTHTHTHISSSIKAQGFLFLFASRIKVQNLLLTNIFNFAKKPNNNGSNTKTFHNTYGNNNEIGASSKCI